MWAEALVEARFARLAGLRKSLEHPVRAKGCPGKTRLAHLNAVSEEVSEQAMLRSPIP